MLNVYFWNKNEKIFQIDLNSDLKENLTWRAGVCLHYLDWYCKDPEYAWIYWNMSQCGKYSSKSVTKNVTSWIYVNMR